MNATIEVPALISAPLIALARDQAASRQQPLLAALEELCGLQPEEFACALAAAFSYELLGMHQLMGCTAAFELAPFAECMRRRCIVAMLEDRLTLVLADPFNENLLSWAAALAPGDIDFRMASQQDIDAWLRLQEDSLGAMGQLGMVEGLAAESDDVIDISLTSISEDTGDAVRLVNSTIYDALKAKASDIHLECDAGCLNVKYRVDGALLHASTVQTPQLAEQVVSRIKVMADLDIGERRIPQDGRFKVKVNGREIDFRVSIMPNIFGEDVVMRLLDRRALAEEAHALRLEVLGLDVMAAEGIRRLAAMPHGMLLVTGPTGSGKTTTLYAAITEVNHGDEKIVTIEDPVEYRLPRVLQIPVNEKKGLTFARGLRSILRHDPDKIMIGEIRDDETAQIAVQAALTGHLVFTTVHANSVFDVLGRFLHMGVEAYSLCAALNGIVAQRLVRLNCRHCNATHEPDVKELRDCGLMPEDVRGWRIQRGRGCGHCRGTGYSGRRAVAEVLQLNEQLRSLIAARAPAGQLKEEAMRTGFQPLRDVARMMVGRGETTLTELKRVSI